VLGFVQVGLFEVRCSYWVYSWGAQVGVLKFVRSSWSVQVGAFLNSWFPFFDGVSHVKVRRLLVHVVMYLVLPATYRRSS
jgi:hypothetical protein